MPDDPSPDLIAKLAHADASERGLLHFLLENIPDRIYFKDRHSRFIRISRAMAQFFGLGSALEAVGKSDFDFFTREHAEPAYADEQRVMETGQAIVGKVEKETLAQGGVRWALTTKMPLRNAKGEMIGTCGISKDFTEQKALEDALAQSNEDLASHRDQLQRTLAELKATQEQLLETERHLTTARMAYNVAHEVRNPLNIIQAASDALASDSAVAASPASAAILQELRTAVARADEVIVDLLKS